LELASYIIIVLHSDGGFYTVMMGPEEKKDNFWSPVDGAEIREKMQKSGRIPENPGGLATLPGGLATLT